MVTAVTEVISVNSTDLIENEESKKDEGKASREKSPYHLGQGQHLQTIRLQLIDHKHKECRLKKAQNLVYFFPFPEAYMNRLTHWISDDVIILGNLVCIDTL